MKSVQTALGFTASLALMAGPAVSSAQTVHTAISTDLKPSTFANCQAMIAETEADISSTPMPPQSSPIPTQLSHVIWIANRMIATLDAHCRSDPNYQSSRQYWVDVKSHSEITCRQVASSPSYCEPRRYGG